MTYCYAGGMQLISRPGSNKMSLIDELFMFLVRIRLGLLQQDLAHRFNVSESTISRSVVTLGIEATTFGIPRRAK